MERNILLNSHEYWLTKMQCDLFRAVNDYMSITNTTKEELAKEAGVTVSVISKMLDGDFDGKLSIMIKILMACKMSTEITLKDI